MKNILNCKIIRYFKMRRHLKKAMEVFELSITNHERFTIKQDLINEVALYHVEDARRIYNNKKIMTQHDTLDWVDVSKKLPPYDTLVLVRVKNKNKSDGIWLYDVCIWTSDNEWYKRIHTWETITHWKILE